MAEEKPAADWERIEADYRAGLLSLREIAKANPGTNHVAITRRAKKEGWVRDLAEKIKARAEDLVTRQAVTAGVTVEREITDRLIIEANAERIAQVRGEHRADIQRVRSLGLSLLGELEGQSSNREHLEQLGDMMRAPDEAGMDRLNDLYRKVISTPSRVDSAKKVAETLKHAIGMEREAYGIGGGDGGPKSPGDAPQGSVFALTRDELVAIACRGRG